MEKFFIGLHHPSDAWPFARSMISVNALIKRKSGFRVNEWIMDSGAFSQISKNGKFVLSSEEYMAEIDRFSKNGNLCAAVCQDWMCEPFILEITGKTLQEHQELTVKSYLELSQWSDVPILPVLQGFCPEDYVRHVKMYGEHLKPEQWVGVGSVCKRNGNPDSIEDVLLSIKRERPDIKLHGFGLKLQAISRGTIQSLLHSSDSMAWSSAGRMRGDDANDPRRALQYAAQIQELINQKTLIQEQLFQWWL
jgi:hypothetical protein